MRNGGGIPQEEGFPVLRGPLQELQRLGVDEVRGVGAAAIAVVVPVVRKFNPRPVVPEVVRVVAMGQQLAVETVELVHSLRLRVSAAAHEAQSPFAEGAGGVTGIPEVVEEGLCPCRKRELSFRLQFPVAADGGVSAVGSRHQTGTRGGAHRGAGIALGETEAGRRQGVDVGRGEALLSVAAQVSPAQVIGQDEDYVGAFLRNFRFIGRAGGRRCGASC